MADLDIDLAAAEGEMMAAIRRYTDLVAKKNRANWKDGPTVKDNQRDDQDAAAQHRGGV